MDDVDVGVVILFTRSFDAVLITTDYLTRRCVQQAARGGFTVLRTFRRAALVCWDRRECLVRRVPCNDVAPTIVCLETDGDIETERQGGREQR